MEECFPGIFKVRDGRGRTAEITAPVLGIPEEMASRWYLLRIYVGIYFGSTEACSMSDRAKLFRTGGSQAVRLPRKYRFEGQREVIIRRQGRAVVLEPAPQKWSRRFIELAGAARDFPYPSEPRPAEPGPDLD